MTLGTLYAIGLGPGDPDLMTVRARRLIEQVPRLFAPVRRAAASSYAVEIAGSLLDPARQQIEVLPFPGERGGWRAHVARMVAALAEGDAAFLTEGDPLLYSTFIDVLAVLRAEYPEVRLSIVPGVPSAMAAAALAGLPLADDDQWLAILPAMHGLAELSGVLERFHTVVLLKIAPVLEAALDQLDAAGLADRVVHVRRVGRPEQSVLVGSAAIRSAPATVRQDYFSLLVVQATPRAQTLTEENVPA